MGLQHLRGVAEWRPTLAFGHAHSVVPPDGHGAHEDRFSCFLLTCHRFVDNFEWASGLVPRFGCVRCDYDTFKRTPKDSSKFVGEVSVVLFSHSLSC